MHRRDLQHVSSLPSTQSRRWSRTRQYGTRCSDPQRKEGGIVVLAGRTGHDCGVGAEAESDVTAGPARGGYVTGQKDLRHMTTCARHWTPSTDSGGVDLDLWQAMQELLADRR